MGDQRSMAQVSRWPAGYLLPHSECKFPWTPPRCIP